MKKFIARNADFLPYFFSFSVFVVLPIACGLFAFLWGAVCDVLFIPGAFLVLVAVPFAIIFSTYCAPVRWLIDDLSFATDGFGRLIGNITGMQYPSDIRTWLCVALFYSLIAVIAAVCIKKINARRHK